MNVRTLVTLALDNRGALREVTLSPCLYREGDYTLAIEGTPGRWMLKSTLMACPRTMKSISIDFGQDWSCVNFDEVLAEAKTCLDEEGMLIPKIV